MNLIIEMRPTLQRWFTAEQLFEPMSKMAFNDLLRYMAESAVGQESEMDVIGASSYLIASGISNQIVSQFMDICGKEIQIFYMNNTLSEWRDWGRRLVTIDSNYNVFVQLGIDQYA